MRWKETNMITERMKFITRLQDEERMSDLCKAFNISRKTYMDPSVKQAKNIVLEKARKGTYIYPTCLWAISLCPGPDGIYSP